MGMQSISGVHYNYSAPVHFWEAYQGIEENRPPLQKFVADAYFALARNVLRYQWLITYLFGNSPALCFMNGRESALQSLDAHTYYKPIATSLPMSDIGLIIITQQPKSERIIQQLRCLYSWLNRCD
jgi:glutamate--cysteine ligase